MSDNTALYLFFLFCVFMLCYMVYRYEEANPCVEWSDKAETVCSGAGDGFDCESYYPCIRRKND